MSADRDAAITRARLVKARALAEVLARHGATGSDVAGLPATSRRTVEELAGVRESSDATWAMVADLVAARRDLSAWMPADPFSVLD